MAWAFDECVLDPEARLLMRQRRPTRLQPLVMDLLIVLVENHRRCVPKSELQAKLWGSVRVGNASLARLVTELRRALGDDSSNPRMVRTVHSRGYQFIAPVAATMNDLG